MIEEIRSDYKRYKNYGGSFLGILFLTQGFWALFQYRVANNVYRLKIPIIRRVLSGLCLIWQKIIEILTGISIPASATIGKACYIGHFGNIIINANAIIGESCNISQGVTIGVSGRNKKRGVPIIGDRVYIGANAVIAGKIKIGDGCLIGANSLVTDSFLNDRTIVGVPAKVINTNSSKDYI